MISIVVLATACRESTDPVRQTLDRIAAAAHSRNARAVSENLTADFRDSGGEGPEEVAAVLRRYFAAYEIVNVKISDVEIERAPEAARARFRVDFSGRPRRIGGLDGLLPSASTYSFDVRLVPDGSSWKAAWASYERVGG